MTTSYMSDNFSADRRDDARVSSNGVVRYVSRLLNAWLVTLLQGLPLYRRDMLVQSQRTRTYVVRTVFAVALFFAALIYTAVQTRASLINSGLGLLGQGRVILDGLVWMLFVFVFVFAPAIASGAITIEKERQTLVLLFLTKLSAWHVVLEKFLSRLLPTFSILLLSVPLLFIAYAFGGVTVEMLGTSIWFLVVTAIQVTAVAVFCSTLCRQTTHAFLLSYGVLMLLYFGALLADIWVTDGLFMQRLMAVADRPIATATFAGTTTGPYGLAGQGLGGSPTPTTAAVAIPRQIMLLACFPPALFAYHYDPAQLSRSFAWEPMFAAGLPALISAMACLLLARCFLYFRAFEDERTPGLERLRQLARRLRMNHVATQKRSVSLTDVPNDEPIAWRESFRSSGNWLPFLLMLEIPTLTTIFWLARTGWGDSETISIVIFILWAMGILLVCVHSSSLVTKERSRQTLDLLLTTPMSSEEIIQQKFNGTRRLMLICAMPLLTCIIFQSWWRAILYVPPVRSAIPDVPTPVGFVWWEYLITASCCVFIYFQLAAWIALWAGLRNKSPARATLDALGGVAFCCVVPQVLLVLPLSILIPVNLVLGFNLVYLVAAQLSPVVMIMITELTELRDLCSIPLLPAVANSVIYSALLLACRRYVLNRADILLGRTVHY